MKLPASNQTEPRDTYKIGYIIHFMLGAGSLLPWNALITAVDYFGHLYPSKHVEKSFSVAYMTSSLLVLALMMTWKATRRASFRVKMNLGISMFIASIMVTPVIDWGWYSVSELQRSSAAYAVTVAAVVVCGLADGLIGGTLIGSAGKLPRQYMQAVFAGTASSGVLVCILRIITKASLPQTAQGLQISAHFYFIFTAAILLVCILCCNLLYNLPVMQQHYKLQQHDLQSPVPEFWDVARNIRWPAFGVFLIYTVTLSIFPGFIAEDLESATLKDWYPVMLITAYNVSDLVGKSLTAVYVVKSVGKVTWACIGRLLFYPLFTLCLHSSHWLKTEVPMAVLTVALGLTNGYLTSAIMIFTPKSVPPSQAEVSALVMAVFLGIGLASGSVLGWVWII